MKVLYLISGVGPPAGWGTEFIQNLVSNLSHKGIDATILTPIYINTHSDWKKWIKEQEDKNGIRILPLEASSWIRRNLQLHFMLTPLLITFYTLKLLRKEKFDVVHEFSSIPIILFRAGLIKFFFKVPTIFTLSVYNQTLLGNFFWFKIFNFAKYYLIPSKEIISKLISMGVNRNKILFSPPGIPLNNFTKKITKIQARKRLHLPKNKFIISYFGPLTAEKGVQEIIRAGQLIDGKILKEILVTLFVIWKGSREHNFLKTQITGGEFSNLKLIEKYIDIPTLMAASDLIVLPQRTGHGTTIPPIGVIEAVAAGKEIITTNILGNKEVLQSTNNVLIPPNNPVVLAEAIEKIYIKSLLYSTRTKPKNIHVHQYDINKSVRIHLALYHRFKQP